MPLFTNVTSSRDKIPVEGIGDYLKRPTKMYMGCTP